jgi:hypothetical protein
MTSFSGGDDAETIRTQTREGKATIFMPGRRKRLTGDHSEVSTDVHL